MSKTQSEIGDKLFVKYLKLLGLQKKGPGLEALNEIVRAHLAKVPFENISKVFFKKRLNLKHLIDFEWYLEGIEKYKFGGTCYANNYFLNQLLSWLGYNVILCGADMKMPDVHIVNIVNIGDREFIVDAGYAAPFIVPLPRNQADDYTIVLGDDRYVLKPQDENNHSRIELYRNGLLCHGYNVNPKPRQIEEFHQVIADSFNEDATFMNALLLTRFETDHSLIVHNMNVIEFLDEMMNKYSLDSLDRLALLIEDRFGIPRAIVQESLSGLQMQGDAWN